MAHLGQKLRKIREQQGIKQHRLAALTGVSPAAISRIEHNTRLPSIELLVRLADVLNISIHDLTPTIDELKEREESTKVAA